MGNRLAVGAILMLTLFFFGCGKPMSGDTVYRFPDQVTEVAVTCYGGGEVAEVTLDAPDVLRAVANWYAGLRLVALQEAPEEVEGNTAYAFAVNGAEAFSYDDRGREAYLQVDGAWYAVQNPSAPPVVPAPG